MQDMHEGGMRRRIGHVAESDLAGSPGDISLLLRTLRLNRRFIVATVAVSLVAGFFVYAFAARRYTAETMLITDFRRLQNVDPNAAVFNFRLSDAAIDSQVALIKSDAIISSAVDKLDLKDDPEFAPIGIFGRIFSSPEGPAARRQQAIETLTARVKAERLDLSYAIMVSAYSTDAAKAAKITDAVAQAFVDDQFESRSDVSTAANKWFQDRLAELQSQVNAAQTEVVNFRANNRMMLADGKFIDETQVEDLSLRVIDMHQRRIMAEAQLKQVQTLLDNTSADNPQFSNQNFFGLSEELRNPIIVGLLQRANEVSVRMTANIAKNGPDHETVIQAQNELQQLNISIRSEFDRIASTIRSNVEIARQEEAALNKILGEWIDRSNSAQKARVRLELLSGTADSLKNLRDTFLQQFSISTQQQSYPITETRIVKHSEIPVAPSWPDRKKVIGGAGLAGVILGCIIAVGNALFSPLIRERSKIERVTGGPVLGYLPNAETRRKSDWIERYGNSVCRSILLDFKVSSSVESRARIIGICGAWGQEGSSSLTGYLARTAAELGQRVLVIDADLQMRTFSKQFCPDASAGLAELLVGQGDLQQIIFTQAVGKFDILPTTASNAVNVARDHMADAVFSSLLKYLGAHYELILLDLPPIGMFTDARSLSDLVDRYLVVIDWKSGKSEQVANAFGRNIEISQKLIGVVSYNFVPSQFIQADDDALSSVLKHYRSNAIAAGANSRN